MASVYEKRWAVAQAEAARVNRMIEKGYLAVTADGQNLMMPFVITETEVLERYERNGHVTEYLWFRHNPEYDDGSHTPIEEIRAKFRSIKFYSPIPVEEGAAT
jgi:hypothetical protein